MSKDTGKGPGGTMGTPAGNFWLLSIGFSFAGHLPAFCWMMV